MARNVYSTSSVTATQGIELHRAAAWSLAEHAGRYEAFAAALNAAEIELIAIDLRGHGKSSGERGVRVFTDYLRDADVLLEACATPPPADTPFLMGHSMGEPSRCDASRRAGSVESGAATGRRGTARWKATLSRIVGTLAPACPRSQSIRRCCRAPDVVEANRRDPLVHHASIPARTAAQMLAAMETRPKAARSDHAAFAGLSRHGGPALRSRRQPGI